MSDLLVAFCGDPFYQPPSYYPDYYLLPIPCLLLMYSLRSFDMLKKSFVGWLGVILIFILPIVIWLYFPSLLRLCRNDLCYPDKASEFGDMFGALSCLFSGLAFAGLIVTIRQQSHDLNQQREEMKNTVAEAKAQTQLMEKQLEEQKKQLREAQEQGERQRKQAQSSQAIDEFFRRLEYLKNLEKDIMRYNHSDNKTLQGSEAIKAIYEDMNKALSFYKDYNKWPNGLNIEYNESLMIWIAFALTLADDIYCRLFSIGDDDSLFGAQYYARILVNSITEQGKALLYFYPQCADSTYLRNAVKKLVKYKALNLGYINQNFQNIDAHKSYKEAYMTQDYRY